MVNDFDLDLDNPKGLGLENFDPAVADEHGRFLSSEDLKTIKELFPGVDIFNVAGMINGHTILSLHSSDNQDTVIFFAGGVGRLHMLTKNGHSAGMIWPLTLLSCWPKDINLCLVDMGHGLSWSWTRNTESTRFKSLSVDKIKSIVKTTMDRLDHKDTVKMLSAFADISTIINEVKEKVTGKVWLAGHCNSCEMISRYHDAVDDTERKIDGMIMTNPSWKRDWRVNDKEIRYFHRPVGYPLLMVQHKNDGNAVTGTDTAQEILKSSRSPISKYVELDGGIDIGLPHFSLGHHGFREIEPQVVEAISGFIKSC